MEALIFILKNDLLDFFTIERYRAATVWARPALKCLPEQPQKRSATAPTPTLGRVRKAATPRRLPLDRDHRVTSGGVKIGSKIPAGAATRRISGRRRATNRLRTMFASSGQCSQFRLAPWAQRAGPKHLAPKNVRGIAAITMVAALHAPAKSKLAGCRKPKSPGNHQDCPSLIDHAGRFVGDAGEIRPRIFGPPIRPDPLRGLGAGSPTEPPAALRSRSCGAERLRTRAGTRGWNTRRMLPWAQPDQDANI